MRTRGRGKGYDLRVEFGEAGLAVVIEDENGVDHNCFQKKQGLHVEVVHDVKGCGILCVRQCLKAARARSHTSRSRLYQ